MVDLAESLRGLAPQVPGLEKYMWLKYLIYMCSGIAFYFYYF